jgi:hypothetical protein
MMNTDSEAITNCLAAAAGRARANAGHLRTVRRAKGEGFFEREISQTSDRFGAIMHVFSTYESRHAPGDPQPFGRGINSVELFNDGTRWWIISVLWDRERPNNPIPAKYLRAERKL